MANTRHNVLTGVELHYSKIFQTSTSPSDPPTYVGESYFDNLNNILYIATGVASVTDWQPVVGSGGGTSSIFDVSTTTYTVVAPDNTSVIRMTNVAARTVTLVTSPINGFSVSIQDGAGTASTANITVNSAGGDIFQGGGTSYVINSNLGAVTFIYDVGTTSWVLKSQYVGTNLNITTIENIVGDDLTISTVSPNANKIKGTTYFQDGTDATKQASIALATATTGTNSILNFAQTANRIITFPDITDTLVTKTSTDTLTNKSFNNTTTMLAANQLNFNNSGNTFHTSLKGGTNAVNLDMTLPIIAPVAGQGLYSTDTAGSLSWATFSTYTSQTFNSAGIGIIPSSTSTVIITGVSFAIITDIDAGVAGQTLIIVNDALLPIRIATGGSVGTQIILPLSPLEMSPGFSLSFVYDSTLSAWVCSSQISAVNIIGGLQDPPAGFIGENKFSSNQTGFSPSSNWQTFTSTPSINPGVWIISGMIMQISGGTINSISMHVGNTFSITPTPPTDLIYGVNATGTVGGSSQTALAVPPWRVVVNTSQICYLNITFSASGAVVLAGSISASRIA